MNKGKNNISNDKIIKANLKYLISADNFEQSCYTLNQTFSWHSCICKNVIESSFFALNNKLVLYFRS